MATMTADDCDRFLKQVLLKDLRIQCRARGLSPAGGKEQLSERLRENMIATNDFNMKAEDGSNVPANNTQAGMSTNDMTEGHGVNNYARPSGQNVGNFLTDRSSSRVMAPPGGASSIVFGASEIPGLPSGSRRGAGANAPGSISQGNNYARPGGQQNVGNFLSDRPSSKVMAPPGGASQITFG